MESLFTFNVYKLASFVTKAWMKRQDGLYRLCQHCLASIFGFWVCLFVQTGVLSATCGPGMLMHDTIIQIKLLRGCFPSSLPGVGDGAQQADAVGAGDGVAGAEGHHRGHGLSKGLLDLVHHAPAGQLLDPTHSRYNPLTKHHSPDPLKYSYALTLPDADTAYKASTLSTPNPNCTPRSLSL